MTKKEIIEKLNSGEELTADELKVIAGHVEKIDVVSLETAKAFLNENEDGKKLVQSLNMTSNNKALESFKANTMPGLIEDAIKVANPKETDSEKQIRILSENQSKLEASIKKKDLLATALKYATKKGIPVEHLDRFIGEDEETTQANLESFESSFNTRLADAVDERFKTGGQGQGGGSGDEKPPKSDDDLSDDEYRAKYNK